MQLIDFLKSYPAPLTQFPIIAFSASSYETLPSIFMTQLTRHLKEHGNSVISLEASKDSFASIIAQLETSFLGMNCIYWLRNLHDTDTKTRMLFYEYLSNYQGPHHIIIADISTALENFFSNHLKVVISDQNMREVVPLLSCIFPGKHDDRIMYYLQRLFKIYQKFSIDQACMIRFYTYVLSKYEDAAEHFGLILEPEHSLFILSQYFFAKQATQFFTCWQQLEKKYPLTFWTVFWSEQLWRAYHARSFLEAGQLQQAKNIGFRLPFSYLQKDWKKFTGDELKNAHQSIYDLELRVKNSREAEAGFDLFYTKFFLNGFCSGD